MDNSNAINKRIASIRRLNGYTQSQIADLLGMKASTYSQMERVGKVPTSVILKFSELFKVHPTVILCGEKENEKDNKKHGDSYSLTNLEAFMIKTFRNLSTNDKIAFFRYIEFLGDENKKAKESLPFDLE